MMLITPVYAALLAFVFVGLSIHTIKQRRRYQVALGDGEKPELMRAMRAHANFAEYVPLALVLVWMAEAVAYPVWVVHALGLALLVGRLSHAYGITQTNENFRFRVFGMALTFSVLLSAGILLLIRPLLSIGG